VSFLNAIANGFFDAITAPFAGMHPYVAIGVMSIVAGVVMLLLFKYCTPQAKMRVVKDRMMAHVLEVLLYRDDMRIFFKSQGNLLKQNSIYTLIVLPAALLMIPAVVPFLTQLEYRYGHRPFQPGEEALVVLQLKDKIPGEDLQVSLEPGPGVEVVTPAVRIRDANEADWRIRAASAGQAELRFKVGDETVTRRVLVGPKYAKITPVVEQASFMGELLNPGEKPLPRESAVKRIEIRYPDTTSRLGATFVGLHLFWLLPFCIISLIFGFALKPFLHVE
jgi:hypothetical protein